MAETKPIPERADLIIDGLDRLTEDRLGMDLGVQIMDSNGKPVEGWRFSIRTAMAEVVNGRTDVQGSYKGHRVLLIRQGTQEKLILVVDDSSVGDCKTVPAERELSPEEIAEIKRRQEEEEERQRQEEAERIRKEEEDRRRQKEERQRREEAERIQKEEEDRQRQEEETRQREERERQAAERAARREAAERRRFEEERREREIEEARKRMVEFERRQQHRAERPKVLRGILEGRGGRIETGEMVVFPSGEHLIRDGIVVLEGGTLRIEPGAKLNFDHCGISCYGLLQVIGTDRNPIQLTSTSYWDGITLFKEGTKGSRLRNCEISNSGRGLGIGHTTNIEIEKLVSRNNREHGISCSFSNMRMRNIKLQRNGCDYRKGGGLLIEGGGEVQIEDFDIENNEAFEGGGCAIVRYPNSSPSRDCPSEVRNFRVAMRNGRIHGNRAYDQGGGIYIYYCRDLTSLYGKYTDTPTSLSFALNVELQGLQFAGNSARPKFLLLLGRHKGSAIYAKTEAPAQVRVWDSTIENPAGNEDNICASSKTNFSLANVPGGKYPIYWTGSMHRLQN